MADLIIVTYDKTYTEPVGLKAALEGIGHTVTLINDSAIGVTDFSSYDAVVVVRPSISSGVAAALRALIDVQNKPMLIGLYGQGMTAWYGRTGLTTHMKLTSTLEAVSGGANGINVTDNTHEITDEFSTGQLVCYTTSAFYWATLDQGTSYPGSALAYGDPDVGGISPNVDTVAIEAGTNDLDSPPVALGARVVLGGWVGGVDTAAGLNLLGAAVTWLVAGGAPTVDPTQSTATVPATGTTGSATSITVQAKDTTGANMTTGGSTVVVSVTGANTATPTVTDVGDGTYTCSYTPTTPGADSVAITLDGTAISGSPYTSTVYTVSDTTFGDNATDGHPNVTRGGHIKGGANSTTNYVDETETKVKRKDSTPAEQSKGLLKFDLSDRAGDTLKSAALKLYVTADPVVNPLVVWECTRDWIEADVTWDAYDGVNAWGADNDAGDAVVSATTEGVTGAYVSFSSAELLSYLQAVLDGTKGAPSHTANLIFWSSGDTPEIEFKFKNKKAETGTRPYLDLEFYGGVTAPVLSSPANGADTTDLTPSFAWSEPTDAVGYQIQIDTTPDFSSSPLDVDDDTLAVATYIASALPVGAYYWRVKAKNAIDEWGDWSLVWAFTIHASAADSTASVPTTGTAGTVTSITVQAKDALGADVTVGGETVVVAVTGTNTATPAVTDNSDGTYTCEYTPTVPGSDTVTITMGGVAISGSPFTSAIYASAAQSTAVVPDGVVGSPTYINIQAKDALGVNVSVGGEGVGILITGANIASPTTLDIGDGTYASEYTPLNAGIDSVVIMFGGVQIGGSPYTSTVTGGEEPAGSATTPRGRSGGLSLGMGLGL